MFFCEKNPVIDFGDVQKKPRFRLVRGASPSDSPVPSALTSWRRADVTAKSEGFGKRVGK
jgi:hypothetical protein